MSDEGPATEPTADEPRPFFVAYHEAETAGGRMTVRIDPDLIASPKMAGVMVADWIVHLAGTMAEAGKAESAEAALRDLLDTLAAELTAPPEDDGAA